MADEGISNKIDHFLKSPNGTTFCEKGKFRRPLYIIKLPLGDNERFGVMMANMLPSDQYTADAIYPAADWKLEVIGYVDNTTGRYISCLGHSELRFVFDYNAGIDMGSAVKEVEEGIRKHLRQVSDQTLFQAAKEDGHDPLAATSLTADEISGINEACRRAFAMDCDPDFGTDPLVGISLQYPSYSFQSAQFAISYLENKDGYITAKAQQCMPALAKDMLHYRALQSAVSKQMEQFQKTPPADILNERAIREAIIGKSTVWATFAHGETALRMLIPTAMFSERETLNDWCLAEKSRHELRTFLSGNTIGSYVLRPRICDIVILEYKGKEIFHNESYFQSYSGRSKPAFEAILQEARDRTADQARDYNSKPDLER